MTSRTLLDCHDTVVLSIYGRGGNTAYMTWTHRCIYNLSKVRHVTGLGVTHWTYDHTVSWVGEQIDGVGLDVSGGVGGGQGGGE